MRSYAQKQRRARVSPCSSRACHTQQHPDRNRPNGPVHALPRRACPAEPSLIKPDHSQSRLSCQAMPYLARPSLSCPGHTLPAKPVLSRTEQSTPSQDKPCLPNRALPCLSQPNPPRRTLSRLRCRTIPRLAAPRPDMPCRSTAHLACHAAHDITRPDVTSMSRRSIPATTGLSDPRQSQKFPACRSMPYPACPRPHNHACRAASSLASPASPRHIVTDLNMPSLSKSRLACQASPSLSSTERAVTRLSCQYPTVPALPDHAMRCHAPPNPDAPCLPIPSNAKLRHALTGISPPCLPNRALP